MPPKDMTDIGSELDDVLKVRLANGRAKGLVLRAGKLLSVHVPAQFKSINEGIVVYCIT